jgi:hypothetical protein
VQLVEIDEVDQVLLIPARDRPPQGPVPREEEHNG